MYSSKRERFINWRCGTNLRFIFSWEHNASVLIMILIVSIFDRSLKCKEINFTL